MSKILWLNWSGGGNLPPSLGIARALTERGHDVSFAGRPEMVARVEAAGFRAIEIKSAYAQVDRYPNGPLRNAGCYLTSPACAADVRGIAEIESPDLVLIDAMFPAALSAASELECPTAVVCHTFLFRLLDQWREMLARLNGMRTQAGFDTAAPAGWDKVRHAGPVLEDEKVAVPVSLPWADDDATPLALISYSTGFEQRSVDKLQRGLDALADLPLHVVATTGGIVDPDAHDQAPNAVTMEQWGVGVALPQDTEVDAIRDAARRILSTPSYRQQAQQRAAVLAGVDGAANAAQEIEALIPA